MLLLISAIVGKRALSFAMQYVVVLDYVAGRSSLFVKYRVIVAIVKYRYGNHAKHRKGRYDDYEFANCFLF